MSRRNPRALLLVILTLVALALLGGFLTAEVGRPYPGFFVAPDYRIFPADAAAEEAGLDWGDRIMDVDGASALTLAARVRADRERGSRRPSCLLWPWPSTRCASG